MGVSELNVSLTVYFSFLENEGDRKVAVAQNIGAGGICIVTEERFKEYTKLSLKIKLPDDKGTIRCKAEVVWCRDYTVSLWRPIRHYEAGLRFYEISDKNRRRIFDFVLAHLPKNQTNKE